jgi:opacity protein-like surface antigen/outer membrane protein OmpA-like peptidoglycan-associated protein
MRSVSRSLVLALVVVGAQAVVPFAANAQDTRQNAAVHAEETFGIVEASAFGGITNFGRVGAGLGTSLGKGADVGVRFTVNPNDFLGIELNGSAYGDHKLKFSNQPRPGVNLPQLDVHVYQMAINALGYFTPRENKVRPFLTVGFGPSFYTPNDRATAAARALDPSFGLSNFSSDTRLTLNYGAGVKWKVHPHIGLRVDVRGLAGQNPKFSLPNSSTTGGAFIPSDKHIQGVQATVGLSLYFGKLSGPPPPPRRCPDGSLPLPDGSCPKPPDEVKPHSLNGGTITASATSICPGETATFSSNASDPLGHSMNYQWSVDGSNQGSASSYTYTAGAPGDYRIGLRVSDTTNDHPAEPVNVSAITLHVKNYGAPTVSSVTVTPSDLERRQTAVLHATASSSECNSPLTFSWSATEGVVNGSTADAQYDSSSVTFNEADRSRPQSKRVTITVTVSCRGGSASGSTNVTVNYIATYKHFGDIVFKKNDARVNNCGKRALIEQLYPLLTANPNYDVVLVGHIDDNEVPKRKGAKGWSLDKDRVLNTAGVLSGGGGTCTALEHSRIRGVWVGSAQGTEFIPPPCTVSTEAPKERKGYDVDPNEAKNRRVEIWLVPKGLGPPPVAANAADLSEADLKRVGCPK